MKNQKEINIKNSDLIKSHIRSCETLMNKIKHESPYFDTFVNRRKNFKETLAQLEEKHGLIHGLILEEKK